MDPGEAKHRGGRLRTLPVNLLLGDRLCLVVGAGMVALRKVTNLLEHGARVVVVAPEAVAGLRALERRGDVVLRMQRYEPALLTEHRPFLVYAATDDDDLNRRIVGEARAASALATSVTCWEAGDFITPAVLPWGAGQVSITTEGTSCRQTKYLRQRLETVLAGSAAHVVWGVERDRLAADEWQRIRPVGDPAADPRVAMLRHLPALEEFALVVSDERFELHAWARRDDGLDAAVRRILGLDALGDRAYVRAGSGVGHPDVAAALRRAVRDGTAADHLQHLLVETVEVAGD